MNDAPAMTDGLAAVRGDLLDCIQVNLAVLADMWHGAGTHRALGAALTFHPRLGTAGLPTVEPVPDEQIRTGGAALGLTVRREWIAPSGPQLVELVRGQGPLYVVADAYHLPWVPYCGHRHLQHSFLLEAGDAALRVIDGYHNTTRWGAARAVTRPVDEALLSTVCRAGARVRRLAPVTLPEPRPVVDVDADTVHRYVSAYRDHPDRSAALEQLTLETWLLSRARGLHALFRTGVGGDTAAVATHLAEWSAVTELAFLAHRRVQRGRGEPDGLYSRLAAALAADPEVFTEAAPKARGEDPDDRVRAVVTAAVVEVLGDEAAGLPDDASLTDVPSFGSFRIVEIIERIEEDLGIELDAAQLVPENLHRVGDLCRLAAAHDAPSHPGGSDQ